MLAPKPTSASLPCAFRLFNSICQSLITFIAALDMSGPPTLRTPNRVTSPSPATADRAKSVLTFPHSASWRLTVYFPLYPDRKEIRVLIVRPGLGNEPIHCELRHTILNTDAQLEYETISYVWGNTDLRGRIYVHGVEVDVPASCEQVLRRMRLDDRPRVLWIDAVCINQLNVPERGRQVALMGEIYSKGTMNLVWLGEEDNSTLVAVAAIEWILEDMCRETDNLATLYDSLYNGVNARHSDTRPRCYMHEDALLQFFSRPWFSRQWGKGSQVKITEADNSLPVIQEVTLARTRRCFCGSLEISLENVLRTAAWLAYKSRFYPRVQTSDNILRARALFDLADREYGYDSRTMHTFASPGTRLLSLLSDSQTFDALEPRDYVYSLLGIFQLDPKVEQLPAALIPDYAISLAQLMHQTAKYLATSQSDLDVLSYVEERLDGQDHQQASSWAPRWYHRDRGDTGPFSFVGLAADGRTRARIRTSEADVLAVEGIALDTVYHIAPIQRPNMPPADMNHHLRLLENMILGHLSNSERLSSILGVTLQAGITASGQVAEEAESGDWYEAYKQFLEANNRHPSISDAFTWKGKGVNDFSQALVNACNNRRLFTLSSGRIGVGPQTMNAGDTVAILYGLCWPAILRPSTRFQETMSMYNWPMYMGSKMAVLCESIKQLEGKTLLSGYVNEMALTSFFDGPGPGPGPQSHLDLDAVPSPADHNLRVVSNMTTSTSLLSFPDQIMQHPEVLDDCGTSLTPDDIHMMKRRDPGILCTLFIISHLLIRSMDCTPARVDLSLPPDIGENAI